MRSFVWKSVTFAMAIVVVFGALEAFIESRPNAAKYKHCWLEKHAGNVGTLILGSSHTLYGIDASMLDAGQNDRAFNLAMVCQTYRYDSYLLAHYDFNRLHTLIMPYSYFSLYEDFESMPDQRYMAFRYLIYMDCDIHNRLSEYGFEVLNPSGVKRKIEYLLSGQECIWDSLGTGVNYTLQARDSLWDDGVAAAAGNTSPDTSLVEMNRRFLGDILSFCHSRNIDLFLITTPVSSTFRCHQDSRQDSINAAVLGDMLREHPEVHYMDFSADGRFTDSDFYDSHHLNTNGRAKLTDIIKALPEFGVII